MAIYKFSQLRTQLAVGVGLPVFLALTGLGIIHYARERHLVEQQISESAIQLGQIVTGSLRHAMLTKDRKTLAAIVSDVGQNETVQRLQLINRRGQVIADSAGNATGQTFVKDSSGCVECHRYPAEVRPRVTTLTAADGTLRAVAPIANAQPCQQCHPPEQTHLGVVVLDTPTLLLQQHALEDLGGDVLLSAAFTVLVSAGLSFSVDRLVIRRVEAFRAPLAQLAAGDFTARLPRNGPDEIGQLAQAFNNMAAKVEAYTQEQAKRGALRQAAIVEERERIARELHDGIAQLLGYFNTKLAAAQLLLQKKQIGAAAENLATLEAATQTVAGDVRLAILGLRLSSQITNGLIPTLSEYVDQFGRLSQLPVELIISPETAELKLDPETEVQALRILQEALSNIHKHAAAG
ncbi:MAG: HAMP domain-containing protein, partial [Anaerolineales bacterium]|nr:HAMP domain-containing protein [Anaerolineales bacterium]